MERKVLVSVTSNNNLEDDVIEVITPGILYEVDDEFRVVYEETQISGMEGTTTSIIVKDDCFILEREGTTSTKMEFKKDIGTIAMYNTPYGMLDVSIFTNDIIMKIEKENGGFIKAKYDMIISGQSPIKTNIEIKVTMQ